MGPWEDSSDDALFGSSTLSARETMYVAETIMMTRRTSMTSTMGVMLIPTIPPLRPRLAPTDAPIFSPPLRADSRKDAKSAPRIRGFDLSYEGPKASRWLRAPPEKRAAHKGA